MKNNLTVLARRLRRNQTDVEGRLWSYLRARKFIGFKFRRQFPIGRYIVDFCCPDKRLIIELDGSQHNEPENIIKDKKRTEYLRSRGYTVLRFWNSKINGNIDGVLEEIFNVLNQ